MEVEVVVVVVEVHSRPPTASVGAGVSSLSSKWVEKEEQLAQRRGRREVERMGGRLAVGRGTKIVPVEEVLGGLERERRRRRPERG